MSKAVQRFVAFAAIAACIVILGQSVALGVQTTRVIALRDKLEVRQRSLEECMDVAHRQHRALDEVIERYGHLLTGVRR